MFILASAKRRLFHLTRIGTHLTSRVGRTGAVAIIMAVGAPVVLMIVGFVIDFGYASYINQSLARATDAATVGSVSQTAATAGGGYGNLSFLQSTGVKYFNANIAKLGVTGVNFSLSVVSDGNNGVIANGSYAYNVPTFFAGILGISNIPVSGSARTAARPAIYVNYYILIDASQSMGIAATQNDMTRLFNLVISQGNQSEGETGCIFGCHVPGINNSGGLQKFSNEYLAHSVASPPIQLRIDAAVQAVQGIISQAQGIAATSKNIKFALYTIQADQTVSPVVNLHPIYPLSNDYAALLNATKTIDLGNNVAGGIGDSDFLNELQDFNQSLTDALVTTNGSGASATSPLNYFFILTDGVPDGCGTSHCTNSPAALTYCTQLKTKGTLGIVYSTYNPIWANNVQNSTLESLYYRFVYPIANYILPNLQSCATSANYFYQANYGPDIVTAMQSLFQSTQPAPDRITQ